MHDVGIPILGALTGELCRPPGRARDHLHRRISYSSLVRCIDRFSVNFGKAAPLLLVRSLAMRSFEEIPEMAMPKKHPFGGPIMGLPGAGMDWQWSARNRWVFDDRLLVRAAADRIIDFADLSSRISLGDIDFETGEILRANADVQAYEAIPDNLHLDERDDGAWFHRSIPRNQNVERVAMDFLRRHLTAEQRLELLSMGYFTTIGSDGGVFRISGKGGPWSIFEMRGTEQIAEWCVVEGPETFPAGCDVVIENQTFKPWPVGDVLVARKLMIETDEPKFREIGNRSKTGSEVVRKDRMLELGRLAMILIEHATDHEWWNAILRSVKVSIPSPELAS